MSTLKFNGSFDYDFRFETFDINSRKLRFVSTSESSSSDEVCESSSECTSSALSIKFRSSFKSVMPVLS